MKKNRKKVFLFVLLMFLFILIGGISLFHFAPAESGYIANVFKSNGGTTVLIADDLSSDQMPKEKLFATLENEGTIFQLPWYVPDHQLKLGQKVKVYFNGKVFLTSPGRADAYWIKVIE
ncbi:hypothetical protein AC623_10785 [Bacillus sp. FJAT-27231]|uniref:DUF3221 domain-containing protein n=1 Tax=Bacillus sp. FJAT-27231 TaxID=1679168 RepID=UPI000670BF47|nr:DUF3221 domain-containing protein [Bacillus sp. FJAT-27231]KMY54354.1 hypothetical protein AC623_10785 [Bacillus sp. FJAT-27231]